MKLFTAKKDPFRVTKREKVLLDKTLNKINSLLSRKDMINVDNERLDAVRLLAYYLETNGREIKSTHLVKFLKG